MPELVVGQAGKELTHNQALAVLDQLAQAVVVDKDLTAPPVSPANGSMYIVAAGATGAWSGQSGKLAYWLTTVAAWTFITPADGWSVWVADEAKRYERVGGAWVLSTAALGLGTAATANLTTSTTDTTAGRVLKTGDAGILGATPQYTDGSLLPNGLGFYCWFMELSGGANYPLGLASNWQGFESGGANTNRGYTIAAAVGSDRMAFRTRSAGVNGPWCENWHSRGANLITADIASFGCGTGSGGTVTQATSKSTAVTLNKPTGQITMSDALLAAGASVQFQLLNNKAATSDTVVTSMSGGGSLLNYSLRSYIGTAGSIFFVLKNESAVDRSEAYQFNFTIIKGAIA